MKTNVIRILESKQIEFSSIEYDWNEEELDAISVAKKIDADPEQVFKTLVANGDKLGYCVFVIPGNYELDLKKSAKASNNKKIELVKVKELKTLTGYLRGGCSPIGMKKSFPTFIDESAQIFDKIYISAGIRGAQIILSPTQLTRLIAAKFADLIYV